MTNQRHGTDRPVQKLLQGLLLLAVLAATISMIVNLGMSVFIDMLSQVEQGLPEETATVEAEMESVMADSESSVLLPAGMYISYSLLFLLMALSSRSQWQPNLYRYGTGFVLFAACAAVFLLAGYKAALLPAAVLHALALAADHVFSLARDHRARNALPRAVFILALVLCACLIMYKETVALLLLLCVSLVRVFYYIARISFSHIRKDVLLKILKKTYAAEILMGLLLLIIAFSLVLPQFEFGIPTFGDALWYCFAIVTTIGFGDFSAVTLPGRIISVILGIYGIIVVALVTSIIVNFYNETKNSDE